MIRRLYRRICSWLFDCRINGCHSPQAVGMLCWTHHHMWRDHILASGIEPADQRTRAWSIRQWVREINAQRKGRP